MTLILPIVSLYFYIEQIIYSQKKIKFEYKVAISLSIVVILEYFLLRSYNLSFLGFDNISSSFILKSQIFDNNLKYFIVYFLSWLTLSRVFSHNPQIKPVSTLLAIFFFTCMALTGPFSLLFFVMGYTVLLDANNISTHNKNGAKYYLLIFAIILAFVTGKDYTFYFPIGMVEAATKIEYFVVALLALSSDKLIVPKDKGYPFSIVCISVPLILYYHDLSSKFYADQNLFIFVFGTLTIGKIIWELIEFKGLKYIIILKSLFLLFSILFFEQKYMMLSCYVFLMTFMQIYNGEFKGEITVEEKRTLYLDNKWLTLAYSLAFLVFNYFLLEVIFNLNPYIGLALSFLIVLVLKDIKSIYLSLKMTKNIQFILYLITQMTIINLYMMVAK